jgi:amino-acid N-acetyltransferase
VIEKSELPQKIWGDCIKCAKFPECDEIALSLSLQNG